MVEKTTQRPLVIVPDRRALLKLDWNRDLTHIFREEDAPRVLNLLTHLFNMGCWDTYLTGSALAHHLHDGGKGYNDVDLVALTRPAELTVTESEAYKALRAAWEDPSRTAMIGNYAYVFEHNRNLGKYMEMYTGIQAERFVLSPIRTIDEIRNNRVPANIDLVLINTQDFDDKFVNGRKTRSEKSISRTIKRVKQR